MDDDIAPGAFLSSTNTSNGSNCYSLGFNPFSAIYLLMFPLALLLNSVAAWVSMHLKSTTTFIVYLKNLIGADLIMTLALPAKAASDLPNASHQIFLLSCRFFSVVFYSAFYTSITFLGLISLDRFTKTVTPHSKFGQNITLSSMISAAVWAQHTDIRRAEAVGLARSRTSPSSDNWNRKLGRKEPLTGGGRLANALGL
ncbi:hypothetical protein WMY93_017833 [Mugilogobius chulae]|uniref:G-protein coupled receptors family 1 profile domain-containing protein n=1 Tax=Mugilogobius chulae TaxID=88201 RepID=A0AAW0NWH6_9GOBI